MNLLSISQKFNTQKKCIKYLETVRWGKKPICPHCGSDNTVKIKTELRHHCNKSGCKRSFSVLVGTIFEESRLPLPKFFVIINLMLNAKNGISASQLARLLDISYKTAWYSTMRIRCAMVETITDLQGIVEADESYLGGKPRKRNNNNTIESSAVLSKLTTEKTEKTKRGRGTKKVPIVGFVERGGRVVVKTINNLTSQSLLTMLKKYVKRDKTKMITDEFRSYNKFDQFIQREVVNHSKKEYVRGNVHTNTIEGFWSIIKNGLRGQYIVLSKKYLPFYLAEFSYKYNRRNNQKLQFESFIKDALSDGKCLLNYKPQKAVKLIAYPRKNKSPKANIKLFQQANRKAELKKADKKKSKEVIIKSKSKIRK